MEAGNRCFSDLVPEEVNRRLIDHCSDIHMPYTERARANLLREGIASDKIFVIGNPILEVIKDVEGSNIVYDLHLGNRSYLLVTAHRQENVDDKSRLSSLLMACSKLAKEYNLPVIFSRHPRTRQRMADWS